MAQASKVFGFACSVDGTSLSCVHFIVAQVWSASMAPFEATFVRLLPNESIAI